MTNFSNKILGKIIKEHIKPIPKWHFLLKRSFIWGVFGISVVLGSFAFGFVLLQLNNTDWEIYHQVSSSFTFFLINVLPYFWGVILIIFLWLAYYNFKHTETGYRHNIFFIVVLSLGLSCLGGSLLYASGINNFAENKFQKVPLYQQIHLRQIQVWNQPERGLLAGMIIEVTNKKIIILEDCHQQKWEVDISEANNRANLSLIPRTKIKMLGEKIDSNEFKAKEIRPMMMGGMRQKMQQGFRP